MKAHDKWVLRLPRSSDQPQFEYVVSVRGKDCVLTPNAQDAMHFDSWAAACDYGRDIPAVQHFVVVRAP
jgi:hypothetical protein